MSEPTADQMKIMIEALLAAHPGCYPLKVGLGRWVVRNKTGCEPVNLSGFCNTENAAIKSAYSRITAQEQEAPIKHHRERTSTDDAMDKILAQESGTAASEPPTAGSAPEPAKYVVPDGMLQAARDAGRKADGFAANNLRVCLQAAMDWLHRDSTPEPDDILPGDVEAIEQARQDLVTGKVYPLADNESQASTNQI